MARQPGRRKPAHLKALEGNPGRRDPKNPPQPKPAIPKLPRGFHKEAAKIYRTLVPVLAEAGLVTEADAVALQDMCLCIARLQEAERAVDEHGLTVPDGRGGVKRNPATLLAKEYRAALLQWARRFGLDPYSRDGLDVAPPGPVDPIQALLESPLQTVLERRSG